MTNADTLTTLLTVIVIKLNELNRDFYLSFQVDDAVTDALEHWPGACVQEHLYLPDETFSAPYVIRSVSVQIGRVRVHAQRSSRPPTAEELALGPGIELRSAERLRSIKLTGA